MGMNCEKTAIMTNSTLNLRVKLLIMTVDECMTVEGLFMNLLLLKIYQVKKENMCYTR